MDIDLRHQGNEAKRAFGTGGDELIQGEEMAEAFGDQEGGVIGQVVGGDDLEIFDAHAEPIFKSLGHALLTGKDQRQADEFLGSEGGLGG